MFSPSPVDIPLEFIVISVSLFIILLIILGIGYESRKKARK